MKRIAGVYVRTHVELAIGGDGVTALRAANAPFDEDADSQTRKHTQGANSSENRAARSFPDPHTPATSLRPGTLSAHPERFLDFFLALSRQSVLPFPHSII